MIDINTLTLGEVAKVEQLSGQGISQIADESQPKGLALAALAYVAQRRSDPKFSWNDAQGLTLDQAKTILGIQDETPDEVEDADADPFESPNPDSES